MARHLSEEEISVFRALFEQYDIDKGGNITVEEFSRVMKQTDKTVTDAQVAKIISEVDIDGDGSIDFDEFLLMMSGRTRAPAAEEAQEPQSPEIDTEADYKSAFQVFAPLDEFINASQFRQAIADLGQTVTDAQVEGVFKGVVDHEKISCEKESHGLPASNSSNAISLLQFWKMKEMNADVDMGGDLYRPRISQICEESITRW